MASSHTQHNGPHHDLSIHLPPPSDTLDHSDDEEDQTSTVIGHRSRENIEKLPFSARQVHITSTNIALSTNRSF